MVPGGKQTSLLSLLLTLVTKYPGGKLAPNICLIPYIYLSSFMCLSTAAYEPFCFSNNSLPLVYLKSRGSRLSFHQPGPKAQGFCLLEKSRLGPMCEKCASDRWGVAVLTPTWLKQIFITGTREPLELGSSERVYQATFIIEPFLQHQNKINLSTILL